MLKQVYYNDMPIRYLTIILLFTCTSLTAQHPDSFIINGRFSSSLVTGKIYLSYSVNGMGTKDSCTIKKGTFLFKGKLNDLVPGKLSFHDNTKEIFLEPGPIAVLCKDKNLKDIETSSSVSLKEFNQINGKLSKIENRWQSVIDTILAVGRRSNFASNELKEWVLKPYFMEVREVYLDFFNKHPQSMITAYYLSQNVIEMNQGSLSTDSLKAYYNKLKPSAKKSLYGEKILEELEKRKVGIPGKEAFSFTETSLNGQPLSLSSFLGKYVLLDFWASWCVPCRKGNPHLKGLYSRYKEKGFDIIGIASDNDTQDAWRKAIEKDDLPWHHILINNLTDKYNIQSFPTKILIDKRGIIIGRFSENEDELDELLSSIFNAKD